MVNGRVQGAEPLLVIYILDAGFRRHDNEVAFAGDDDKLFGGLRQKTPNSPYI